MMPCFRFKGKPKVVKEFYYYAKDTFGEIVKTSCYQGAVYLFSDDGYLHTGNFYDGEGNFESNLFTNEKIIYNKTPLDHLDLDGCTFEYDETGNWIKAILKSEIDDGEYSYSIVERKIEYF
jgi:hypothetical protein